MKAVASREQDLLDVDALLAAHPKLDRERIRRWVRVFADALDSPELYEQLQQRLAKQKKKK
jgi:hypothetical protein